MEILNENRTIIGEGPVWNEKEQKLIKMSVVAFVSSVVSTLIYYIPILTRLETKTIKLLIDFDDILYIALAVLAAVYFFAAHRNFTNKHYK